MKKISFKSFSKFLPLIAFLVFVPGIVFAQTTVTTLINKLGDILKALVPLLMTLGLIYFIWGVIRYVIADGEEAKKKGKDTMVYGIIGFAVITALWGLVNMVVEVFGGQGTTPQVGQVSCSVNPPAVGSALSAYLDYVTCIIGKSAIPLVFALAAAFFIWGVVKFFFLNVDEEAKRAQGKQYMIWGIIALAVMLSMWGLVNVLRSTFNLGTGSVLPTVQPPGN